jgi:hypothetical protein
LLNLHRVGLSKYRDIVDYLQILKPSLKLTENSIDSLKKRSIKVKSVPKSKESVPKSKESVPKSKESSEFVSYVRMKFKEFDRKAFSGLIHFKSKNMSQFYSN